MKTRKGIIVLFAAVMVFSASGSAYSANIEKSAEYVAAMLISGRGVVARHQGLINDPAKGDKGFTSEYVEKLMIESFQKSTNIKISELEPDVQKNVEAVLAAAKRSVMLNQNRINRKGVGFKGYIPAVFGRETGQILKAMTGIDVKQTTHKYRNQYNKPDRFESETLAMFEDPSYEKGKGYGKMSGDKYRYLKPIYIKKACLKCHGDPKGARDIAGKIKEGYKVGDLRGAVSVSISMQ